MHKIRYVILNGPPASGKSTMARELCHALTTRDVICKLDSLAAPMKHFISTALGRQYDTFQKDQAVPELNGETIRAALIDLAESYLKKKYGEDIFGRWLVHRSLHNPKRLPNYVVVDDGGSMPEMDVIPNRCIIKVIRAGRDFTNDSRSYHPYPNMVWNNKSPALAGVWQDAERLAAQVEMMNWQ